MARNWRRIGRHYLAALGSYLFYFPYLVYKGVKTGFHFLKREYNEAAYNLSATFTHGFLHPVYSLWRFLFRGTYEAVTGRDLFGR